jgi:uncharacterized protein
VPPPSRNLSPVAGGDRLASVDVLRALALFGVLIVNLLTELRVSIFEQFLGPATGSALDRALDRFVALAIESKAFVLFSLLFGVGLAIQRERAREAGRAFGRHVARRMGALFIIGLVHLVLVWNGDILTEYAVAGLLMAPLVGLSRRVLLALALVFFVIFVAPLPYPEPFADRDAIAAHIAAATRAYANGGLREVLAFRVHELPPILALDLSALPRTLGLFALGAWVWRAEIFQHPEKQRLLLVVTAIVGLTLAGGVTVMTSGVFLEAPRGLGAWGGVLDGFSVIVLALGYGAAFLLLYQQQLARRLFAPLAPLGRMALTNYLTQSVVFGIVFYGYGFGQFGKMSVASATLLGVATYLAQALISAAWLRRFRFGPVEWIWRVATYGSWQPMRVAL